MKDELNQVDRTQVAGAIRWQRDLTARIGGADALAVSKIVLPVDPIDEQHAGFGTLVAGLHDPVPQRPRPHHTQHHARHAACIAGPFTLNDRVAGMLPAGETVCRKHQRPFIVCVHRLHERIADQYREVEIMQLAGLLLGVDERLDIRMVAAQCRHHGAAPRGRGQQGLAHAVPDAHERDRPGRRTADSPGRYARRTQGRKIVTDPAPGLHRDRAFLQGLEDAFHRIFDAPHDEAVEQSHVETGAGTSKNPPSGQKVKRIQLCIEALLTVRLV